MKKLYGASVVNKYKIWLLLPLVVILVACIVFAGYAIKHHDVSKGMNIGIDFAGGSVVTVILGEDALTGNGYDDNVAIIENAITDRTIAEQVVEYAKETLGRDISVDNVYGSISYAQRSDTGRNQAIVVKYDNISKTFDEDNQITQYRNELIRKSLSDHYGEGIEVTMSNIGATASASLINTALLSVFITLVLILIYIIIRFEIWSGLAAIMGLMHDVIMMFALTTIFHIQLNSAFIAAMITIVAYSINNTIVVFDRVRENMKHEKSLAGAINNNAVVDKSIWETLLRSINSTLTTMVAIVIFAILGAASVQEFALPVIFGLIAGFYSSLCVAPSLYCLMKNAADKSKLKKKGFVPANNAKTAKKDGNKEKKYAGM